MEMDLYFIPTWAKEGGEEGLDNLYIKTSLH